MRRGIANRRARLASLLPLVVSGVLAGCATPAPFRACDMPAAKPTSRPESTLPSGPISPSATPQTGHLLVYSATYVPTFEQSEYPVHTDYTIATAQGEVIEHVANSAGPFKEYPANVTLPSGEYHIHAQYDRGGFVDFSVVIEPGKITTVDLDNEPLRPVGHFVCEPIRLPGGRAVGWSAIT